MIEFPEDEQRKIFRQCFKGGAIFRFEQFEFDDGTTKPKFILILNPLDEDGNCHFFLTTSQTSKIRFSPIRNERTYILPPAEVPCFPKETAFEITNIRSLQYASLEGKYVRHTYREKLEYVQMMPDNILADIQKMILDSPYLSPLQKLKIFPRPINP